MLKLYNSLTKQKETFEPMVPGQVGLYVCGVTVYDYCHIGHARTYVAFDMIVRYLRHSGYQVNYIRNITDVNEKITKRAEEKGVSSEQIIQQYTALMYEHFDALGIARPSFEPKATEYIPHMIQMIQSLLDQGFAYVLHEDVYFRVASFPTYGALSGQDLAALQSGIRVEINDDKESPLDFALWKGAKPGEPSWDAPWGRGSPGWHIECSAMSSSCLGNTFDIHAGGSDLRFPHHENEIAQSEAAHGCHYARYWMHSGMVQVNQEKMSKSLGNFFTIIEVLNQYPAEVVRFFLLSAHYRSEIHYSEEHLNSAQAALTRFYTALRGLDTHSIEDHDAFTPAFEAAMNDDFNTPVALSVLFDCAKTINRLKEADIKQAERLAGTLKRLLGILGLCQQDPEIFLKGSEPNLDTSFIHTLIEKRQTAKLEKNFAEADRIRSELLASGIVLEDGKTGTTWKKI